MARAAELSLVEESYEIKYEPESLYKKDPQEVPNEETSAGLKEYKSIYI